MQTIHITVRNKFAVCTEPEAIVANNTDWKVVFDFDEEWDDANNKYCRFYYNNFKLDKFFIGNEVVAPSRQEVEQLLNNGPIPPYIALSVYSIDNNSTDIESGVVFSDPVFSSIVYLKVIPSLEELGPMGPYDTDLYNLLFPTTTQLPIAGHPEWKVNWPDGEQGEINIACGDNYLHSFFNDVTIEINGRKPVVIEVPLNIYDENNNLDDMEWGKDYIFQYQLDYGYNCAYWWTYEINGQAIWKSPVVAQLEKDERLSARKQKTVCLQPTNRNDFRTAKKLRLHIVGTFGDNYMQGGKLRFLNIRVLKREDQSEFKPEKITQSNYIGTYSKPSAIHKWKLGNNTTIFSTFKDEDEYVIVNSFDKSWDPQDLYQIIYASQGNSLFPQNDKGQFNGKNWNVSGIVYNTSKQPIYIYAIAKIKGNKDMYFIGSQKNNKHGKLEFSFDFDYTQAIPIKQGIIDLISNQLSNQRINIVSKEFEYIRIGVYGGNEAGLEGNSILIENLTLHDTLKPEESPIEYINTVLTSGKSTGGKGNNDGQFVTGEKEESENND